MSYDLYAQIRKPFKADEHEFNFQGHIYVSVNATICRLNELVELEQDWDVRVRLGLGTGTNIPATVVREMKPVAWSFESKHFSQTLNPNSTSGGKPQYDCFAVGELSIGDLGVRMGTGADTNADLDTAAKSAQAYAIRKAGNQFGLAMYLLQNPKAEAELVKYLQSADQDDPAHMKEGVVRMMKIKKMEPTAANLNSEFGVTLEDIKADPDTFLKILQRENRL